MNVVHLLPVGNIDTLLLQRLCRSLPECLPLRCEIVASRLDPGFAYHAERQQFHSSEILQRIQHLGTRSWRMLAIADVDLYIPILTYVFGEAQMGGRCAVVSAFRLRQEFYGLQGDEDLLCERVLKECVHELGHTLELRHCQDYRCAMASAHAVEWSDLRERTLCETCRLRVEAGRCFELAQAAHDKVSPS